MKNNINKYGAILSIIITAVLIIILNVCVFAIPFTQINEKVFYFTYACTMITIISLFVISITQVFLEKNSNQKILGLPIVYSSYIINIIQIVFLIITCVVNSYINMPLWIDIVVECIIIGLLIIQISKGLFFKSRNAEYHENIANTAFMDKFRSDLKIICSINKMPNIQDELNDLLDIALGSDPVTNDKTIELESELMLLIKELDSNIKENSFDNTNKTLINIREILIERNNICKTGK